jgi:hypothetical protein
MNEKDLVLSDHGYIVEYKYEYKLDPQSVGRVWVNGKEVNYQEGQWYALHGGKQKIILPGINMEGK